MREASFYTKAGGMVECLLCPNRCQIKDGSSGACRVRTNRGNTLYAETYGIASGIAVDPVEKKPLYHFHPGGKIFSVGSYGCNMRCPFCQNYHISQSVNLSGGKMTPDELIGSAVRNGLMMIAYTYSEPIVWYEFIFDSAVKAKEKSLKNVLVTNGYIEPIPLEEILPYIDAFNIDLKAFRDVSYKKYMKSSLSQVMKTIETVSKRSHLEITTLIVTGINDNIQEMKDIVDWISLINDEIPWHISRYFPAYNYSEKATDIGFMVDVYDMAKSKLKNVYVGNISGSEYQNTYCPDCGKTVIERNSYNIRIANLDKNACGYCGKKLNIIN